MRRFVIAKLIAAFVLGTLAVAVTDAHAQIKFGPNGQIGIPNLFGTTTWIHPDRMNPLANIPITPPQTPPGVIGQTWLGADNKLHGNVFDPSTGDFQMFKHTSPGGSGNNNFLVEEGGNPPSAGAIPHFHGQRQLNHPPIAPPWGSGSQRMIRPRMQPSATFRAPHRWR
jgi:hypothetical protein